MPKWTVKRYRLGRLLQNWSAFNRLDPFGVCCTPQAFSPTNRSVTSDYNNSANNPGKFADLAMLAADPLSVPVAELGSIEVEETWIAGRLVGTAVA